MDRIYKDKDNVLKIKEKISFYIGNGNAKSIDGTSIFGEGASRHLSIYSIENPAVAAVESFGDMRDFGIYHNFSLIGEENKINELEKIIGIKPEN